MEITSFCPLSAPMGILNCSTCTAQTEAACTALQTTRECLMDQLCLTLETITTTNETSFTRDCFPSAACSFPSVICDTINETSNGTTLSCNVECCNTSLCNAGVSPVIPTSGAPSTAAPSTAAMTTAAPTTAAPTTTAPAPTTAAPTTAVGKLVNYSYFQFRCGRYLILKNRAFPGLTASTTLAYLTIVEWGRI